MHISVYLPLLICVLLALGSPRLATRLPPPVAARILCASAFGSAAASTWALVLLSASVAAQDTKLARAGHWSPVLLAAADPVPRLAGLGAGLLLAVAGGRALLTLKDQVRARRARHALCADPDAGELLILQESAPQAFAVPGPCPRIAVSVGMLRALSAAQRRVLFAHERSHLYHHHHRYLALAAVAAAMNPLLIRTRRDIAYCCERWADEDAATTVGSRALAAQALARAALTALTPTRPVAGMAFQQLRVTHRLAALAAPQTRPRPILAAGYALLAALSLVSATDASMAMIRLLHAAAHR